MIAIVDVPSESNSENNTLVQSVEIRETPLLTFDGFRTESLIVRSRHSTQIEPFEFQFSVRNDHSQPSNDGEFTAEVRLNDGRVETHTDLHPSVDDATDLPPHTSSTGTVEFLVHDLPLGRHEVVLFQSGREVGNAPFEVQSLAPHQFASVIDRSASAMAGIPGGVEVEWIVETVEPIRLLHSVYWSSDPWLDSHDVLLGLDSSDHAAGPRTLKGFYSAEEFVGQDGFLILRTVGSENTFPNKVLDTYSTPVSLSDSAGQNPESVFIVDVGKPYQESNNSSDESVDVWLFNNGPTISPSVQLVAEDPDDPNTKFEFLPKSLSGLENGEFGRITMPFSDTGIDFSPYRLTARITNSGVADQPDPPGQILELNRADLRIADVEIPQLVEEGAVIRWTVENQSDIPWEGTREDFITFKASEDAAVNPQVRVSVNETLMPGGQVVVEAAIPPFLVPFANGFVTVQLGEDDLPGRSPNPDDDVWTEPASFSWAAIEFEPVESAPLLRVGDNELTFRLTNTGTVPVSDYFTFEMSVGNDLYVFPRWNPDVTHIDVGESVQLPIEFELNRFAVGGAELNATLQSLDTTRTFALGAPVASPNFAASDLRVETLPNRDLRVRWIVTNVSDTATLRGEPDSVRVSGGSPHFGPDQMIRLEPGASYEASVIVPRASLGTGPVVDLTAISGSVNDTDPADNELPFQVDTEFTALEVQADEVQHSVSAPTTVPFTIVNRGDFTIDAGQPFSVRLERRWWQQDGQTWDVQELEQTLELQSSLPPGGSVSGNFAVDPLESLFDVRELETITVRVSAFTSFENGHSEESSDLYGTSMIDRSVVDLATSELSARITDFDSELVEATWKVTNIGDVAFEGPVVANVYTQGYRPPFGQVQAGTYSRDVRLESGESVTFTETFPVTHLTHLIDQLEVGVSVFGSVSTQTEGSRANDAQTVTVPVSQHFPVIEIDSSNVDVDDSGEIRFSITNRGDLPLRGRAYFRFSYSHIRHPDAPRQSLSNQWIEIEEPLLGGQTSGLLTAQIDLPEPVLAEYGSLYVWATSGNGSGHAEWSRSRALKLETLNVPSWMIAGRLTPIQVRIHDESDGQTPWSLVARHGGEPIELTLERDEPVSGGDYEGTAWLRLPESLADQTLDLEFVVQLEDGSVADSATRSVRAGSQDVMLEQLEVQLVSGGTQLQVDWRVGGTDVQALGANWVDSIVISEDSVLDSSDIVLGSIPNRHSVWMDLEDGPSYRHTRTFPLTGLELIGDYYVILNGDASDQLLEFSEENNQLIQALSVPTPRLDIQLASSSDTGWSDRDGITNRVNPSFLVNVPRGGRLTIDFDGDDLPDLTRLFSTAGIHSFPVEESFQEGTHEIVVALDDGETTEMSSTVIEVDTTAPEQLPFNQRYTWPLAWFRGVTSEPVVTADNASVRNRRFVSEYLTLELTDPTNEFVVSIPEGIASRSTFELYGVEDIAGNRLDGPEFTPLVTSNRECAFMNPDLPADTNGDGAVTVRDALLGINLLAIVNVAGNHRYPHGFVDVNCSGTFSPLDPLLVINELARQASAAGEGEFLPAGDEPEWIKRNNEDFEGRLVHLERSFLEASLVNAPSISHSTLPDREYDLMPEVEEAMSTTPHDSALIDLAVLDLDVLDE
ncbi:MAG: Ig-like domain-containing protein [Planctomycetota bacterium]